MSGSARGAQERLEQYRILQFIDQLIYTGHTDEARQWLEETFPADGIDAAARAGGRR